MKALSLTLLFITTLATTLTAASSPPGYQQVTEPTEPSDPSRVEVIDFFWYGCPYCNHFEPQLEAWLESKPDNVDFTRIPAVTRQGWAHYARTYYTARALGLPEQFHKQLFAAIHQDDRDLENMDELAAFFAAQGVNRVRFEETFNSEDVSLKVQEAGRLTRLYGIDSVPAIVVNGKYRTNPELAGGASQMPGIVNGLIEVEQKETTSP